MSADATRLAILYAGRWFGRASQHYVDNHRAHLIDPALAAGAKVSVFLIASPDQWCSASGRDDGSTLEAEVQSMFGSSVFARAALVPEPEAIDSRGSGLVTAAQQAAMRGGGKGGHASAFKINELMMYLRQFGNVARAEELRRRHGPHDMILKARLDVQYSKPVDAVDLWHAIAMSDANVFATQLYTIEYSPEYTWPQWRDWNLVMGERCADAMYDSSRLGNYTHPLYNASRRCFGYCIEEQLKLQLEHRGCTYLPLPWDLKQHRIFHRASAEETEAARAERLSVAIAQNEAGQRWREAHGLKDGKVSPQCLAAGNAHDREPLNGTSSDVPPTWGG